MQFIDQAEVEVVAGKGGDGIVAFHREKYVPAGGPSGGNGGRGGSVILEADENLQTLLDFKYENCFKAEDGKRGGPKNKTGAKGRDRVLPVPCGTIIYDLDKEEVIGDLTQHQQQFCVAQGGKGGLGNRHFLSNQNRAPEKALPGLPGEQRRLRLELKLLAEVGIVGLPNAGKSTLIAALSSARPKIADYPFTTLIPNLGIVRKPTGDGTVFADIPGLIAGAHEGVGLGHEFLRHIERTKILIHVIDLTTENPIEDYKIIQEELLAYKPSLAQRPQILVLNKVDAVDEEIQAIVKTEFSQQIDSPILLISAATREGLETLLNQVWEVLESC